MPELKDCSTEPVVPAKAGTQRLESRQSHWVPAFAGTTVPEGIEVFFKFGALGGREAVSCEAGVPA